ncbi:recombinase family protein [Geomicrobium sp. JSM 1781026]|uniref:recombinase family protein n=1 Tax=Geomicrobium sp. JSM 1781026 TaxID=3344580 RepID=UPI0035BF3930
MIYGYVNPYSRDEKGFIQRQMLKNYGVDFVFEEQEFGKADEPVELEKLMDTVKPKDTIVVIKLSCFASSSEQLIDNLSKLREQGVRFISLFDGMDTRKNGELYLNMIKRMDEFGFDVRSERTRLGIHKNKKKS